MKGRVRWSTVTIALAVIAAMAMVSTAIGGPSLKKLVKKEVSKQISKATGPAGANGTNGTNGLDGTARAYAKVTPNSSFPCSPGCQVDFQKGIESVTHPSLGRYCVSAPAVNPDTVAAAVTVEWASTQDPEGNTSAMIRTSHIACPGAFEVITDRQPNIDVRNAADNGSTTVSGPADFADDVGFTIVIP
jgi:hypothetical protein